MNVIKARKPMSLASFLKEASSIGSSIKYRAEKSKQHRMYIPRGQFQDFAEDGTPIMVTAPFAESHMVHEWKLGDKFYSAECTKERLGTCPFCDRINDAWDIYNDRYAKAEAELKAKGMNDAEVQWQMRGEQDKEKRKQPNAFKGLSATFLDELKMKAIKPYMYLLVAQYELDAAGNPITEKGMPKFNLKVWRLPEGRAQKLFDIFATAGGTIEGNEITIQYKDLDDPAQLVGQSTPASVFPDYTFIKQFPGLQEKIEEEAAAFDMESIAKSFEELKELELASAKNLADLGFAKWDAYKAEKQVNAGAVYLEYSTASATPNLNGGVQGGTTFALPNMNAGQPQTAPAMQAPPVMPNVQTAPPVMPPQQAAPVVPPTTQQAAPVQPPVGQAAQAAPQNVAAGADPNAQQAFKFTI